MKTKLDRYGLSILIKGMYSMKDCYSPETRSRIYDLLPWLIDIFDNMDPDHKAKIVFDGTEHRIVLHCLIDWRNQFLKEGEHSTADSVGELFIKQTSYSLSEPYKDILGLTLTR